MNAFLEFYNCLKLILEQDHGVKPTDDIAAKASEIIGSGFSDPEVVREIVSLGKQLEDGTLDVEKNPITLTEVIGIKMFIDNYLMRKANKEVKEDILRRHENNEDQ